jgi:hypothetical protein
MKPIEKPIMKLYASEADAVAHEGNIKGIDGCLYDSLEQAESYFPEGRVSPLLKAVGYGWRGQHITIPTGHILILVIVLTN